MIERDPIFRPKVSIGLPVYNAERYLEEGLNSILNQSHEDFEVVISDNGSTDRTPEICSRYASKDERIRYVRQRQNYGVVHNFNQVYRLSNGEYFKWAAADDLCGRDYLLRAVEVLDSDPSVVLVWAKTTGIDENGDRIELVSEVSDLNSPESVYSPDPVVRFRRLMQHMWWVDGPFYGVIRSSVLDKTALHPMHMSGDQIFITELSMHGRFYEIPEELFFTRVHTHKTSNVKSLRERAAVIEDAPAARARASRWKLIRGYPDRIRRYFAIVSAAPISKRERRACYVEILKTIAWWIRYQASGLPGLKWARPSYPARG